MSQTNLTKTQKLIQIVFDGVTVNSTSEAISVADGARTIEDILTGTGSISATINWYGTNTERTSNGQLFAISTLSGTTITASGASTIQEWPYVYAVVSGLTGTNATLTSTIGN